MNIFTDKRIKALFFKILTCTALFTAAALFFMPDGRLIFILGLIAIAAISLACFGYFYRQNKIIEHAALQINKYISGNTDARIDCNEDGELYKLFHEINSMAAILNAHTEKQYKSKQFLKNTVSDISHQLKTPLSALSIYNGIIQDNPKDKDAVKEFARLSEQELDRIETLIQNLLKITKLDSGTITFNKKEENVRDILHGIKERFAYRTADEEKQLTIDGDSSISLFCDRIWITQAIENIVKNALDHTSENGIISIEWKQFASVVQIIIKDNGSGIHPEDLHHIFKRFYRSRFSKDIQGVGLGLPLAKAIIEEHNGTVEVDSELGKGTTFTITFLQLN